MARPARAAAGWSAAAARAALRARCRAVIPPPRVRRCRRTRRRPSNRTGRTPSRTPRAGTIPFAPGARWRAPAHDRRTRSGSDHLVARTCRFPRLFLPGSRTASRRGLEFNQQGDRPCVICSSPPPPVRCSSAAPRSRNPARVAIPAKNPRRRRRPAPPRSRCSAARARAAIWASSRGPRPQSPGSGQGGAIGTNPSGPGGNPAYTGQQQPPYGSQQTPPYGSQQTPPRR